MPNLSNANSSTTRNSMATSTTIVSVGTTITRHPPAKTAGPASTTEATVNGTTNTKSPNAIADFTVQSDAPGTTSDTDDNGARGTVGRGSDLSGGVTGLTVAAFTGAAPSKSVTLMPQTDSSGNPITDDGPTPPFGATGQGRSVTYSRTDSTDDDSGSGDATAMTGGSGQSTDATDDALRYTGATGHFSGRPGTPRDSSDHTRNGGGPRPTYPPGWTGPMDGPNAGKDSTDGGYGSDGTGGPDGSSGIGPTKFPHGGSSHTSAPINGSGRTPTNDRPPYPQGWTGPTEDPNEPLPTDSNGHPIPSSNAGKDDHSDSTGDGHGSGGTGGPTGSGGSDPTKLPLSSNISAPTGGSELTPPRDRPTYPPGWSGLTESANQPVPTESNGRPITPPSNPQLGGSTRPQYGSDGNGASNGPGGDGKNIIGSDSQGGSGATRSPPGSGMTTGLSNKTASTTIMVSQSTLGSHKPSGDSKAPGSGSSTNFPGGSDGSGNSDDRNAGHSTPSDEGSGGSSPNGATGGWRHGSGVVTTARTLGTVIPTEYPLVPINKTYTDAEIEKLIDYYGLDRNASQTSLEAQVQDRMLEVMRNIEPAVRQQIGYQLKDIMISCSYNGEECDYDNDFVYVSDPDFGNCYTYNANGTQPIVGSGTDYGLRIIAFSNVSEYLYTSSKAGTRVTLHKQNYASFPNTEGYNVGVGSYMAISVQYNDIKRLSRPYGNCTPEDHTDGMIYEGWYTYEGCFRSCFQNDIIAQCGCADSRFPLPLDNSSAEYCRPANKEAFLCYQQYLLVKGDYNAVENCTCTTGCEEGVFNVELSGAAWPIYFENFTTPLCFGTYPNTNVDCYTAYSENAVWIDISYDSSTYEYTNERPVMDGMDLFHNLSGAVCLWLGISMVALMEIVELLSYICLSSGFSPKKSPSVADMNALGGADGFSPYAVDEADLYGPPPTYFPPDSSSFAYVDAGMSPASYVHDEDAARSASLVGVKFCSD